MLEGWGVTVNKDLVLDMSGVGQLFGLGPEFPLVTNYGSTPSWPDEGLRIGIPDRALPGRQERRQDHGRETV